MPRTPSLVVISVHNSKIWYADGLLHCAVSCDTLLHVRPNSLHDEVWYLASLTKRCQFRKQLALTSVQLFMCVAHQLDFSALHHFDSQLRLPETEVTHCRISTKSSWCVRAWFFFYPFFFETAMKWERQCRCRVTKKEMRAPQWRARKRPRLTIKNGQTKGVREAEKHG